MAFGQVSGRNTSSFKKMVKMYPGFFLAFPWDFKHSRLPVPLAGQDDDNSSAPSPRLLPCTGAGSKWQCNQRSLGL